MPAADFDALTDCPPAALEVVHTCTHHIPANTSTPPPRSATSFGLKPKLQALQAGSNSAPRPGCKATEQQIQCALYLAKAQVLYLGLQTGTLAAWDLSTTKSRAVLQVLGSHKGPTTCLYVSRSANCALGTGLVVTGSADFTIKVWDPSLATATEASACVQTLVGHGGTVTCLAATGAQLLSSSTDCTVRLWQAAQGREVMAYPWFEPLATLATMDGWVTSLSYDASQRVGDFGVLYAADSSGSIVRARPRVGPLVTTWAPGTRAEWRLEGRSADGDGRPQLAFRRVHDRGITSSLYIAEAGMLLVLAYDNTLRVFDERAGACCCVLDNASACPFTCMYFDADHSQVLLGDARGYLSIWDLARQRLLARKRLVAEPVLAIFAAAGPGAFGVACARRVEFWRVVRDLHYNVVRGGHTGPVIALCTVDGGLAPGSSASACGDFRVVSAGLDNTVRLWDPADMICLRVLREQRSELSALAFLAPRNMPITGHDDGCIRLWNLDTGSTINMHEHTNTVTCLILARLSKQEEVLISGGFDGNVCVWSVRKRAQERPHLVFRMTAHPGSEVLCLRHDPSKSVLLTAGNDCKVKVWDTKTYDLVGEHVGHEEPVTCLALDANFLFSGSQDASIRVWDTVPASLRRTQWPFHGGTHLKTLTGHSSTVMGLEVLHLSGHLVSIALTGQVFVWDYPSSSVLQKFEHTDEFRCLALRYDADEIIVGTTENNILRFQAGEHVGAHTANQPARSPT